MSSSMNTEKAHEIAKQMTYRDAVYNALRGRCVPYKKATRIKLNELLEFIENCNFIKITENGRIDIDIEMMQAISQYGEHIKCENGKRTNG